MTTARTGTIGRSDRIKIAILVLVVGFLPAYVFWRFVMDRLGDLFSGARAQLFGQVLLAILMEAFPFVLMGAIVSGVVEVFVPPERLARIVPKRLITRLLAAVALGVIFPVCDCGIVPVARRLIRKGLPIEMGMVYMLAGPIVNPMVIASTVVAFVGQGLVIWMPVARVTCAVAVALVVGYIVARWSGTEKKGTFYFSGNSPTAQEQGTDGKSRMSPFFTDEPHEHQKVLPHVLEHVMGDFLLLGGYLLFGAVLASAFQAFVPRNILVSFGQTPVVASAGMMVMAFIMNLCSEADAFIAATFTQFSFAGRLAFLVFGPMLDFKMVAMYLGAFPRKMLLAVLVIAPPLVVAVCELAGWLHGLAAAGPR